MGMHVYSDLVCQLPQHGTIQYTYRLLFSATVERVFHIFSFYFLSPLSSLPFSSLPLPLLSVHVLHKLATNAQAVTDRYTQQLRLSMGSMSVV